MIEETLKKIRNIDFAKIEFFISTMAETYILESDVYNPNGTIEISDIDYKVEYYSAYDFLEWIINGDAWYEVYLKIIANKQTYSDSFLIREYDLSFDIPDILQKIKQITLDEFLIFEKIKNNVLNKTAEAIKNIHKQSINTDDIEIYLPDIFDCFLRSDFKLFFRINQKWSSFDLGKDFSKILDETTLFTCDKDENGSYSIYPTTRGRFIIDTI